MVVPFKTPGGVIWVEVGGTGDASAVAGDLASIAFDSYEEVLTAVKANTGLLHGMLADLGASKVDVSFGIKAAIASGPNLGAGRRVFALAEGLDSAHYCVNVSWSSDDNG